MAKLSRREKAQLQEALERERHGGKMTPQEWNLVLKATRPTIRQAVGIFAQMIFQKWNEPEKVSLNADQKRALALERARNIADLENHWENQGADHRAQLAKLKTAVREMMEDAGDVVMGVVKKLKPSEMREARRAARASIYFGRAPSQREKQLIDRGFYNLAARSLLKNAAEKVGLRKRWGK